MSLPKTPPLSPHLQIYRPQWTSVLSILHRLTGIALTFGLVMVTWFFGALSAGPDYFAIFTAFAGSWMGMFMMFGWSFALCFHACSGVRHLFFDLGYLFDIHNAERVGKIMLGVAVLLTLAVWVGVYCMGGVS
jgi:succinate dehydrogenase / fumarate reductase cytochrome b subunit